MASVVLNKKGQVSIEFVLLLLVGLIYLQTISSAVITPAINSATDVSNVGEARLATEKIVNSINELSSSPGDAKKTINVFVPENTEIRCNSTSKSVSFSVTVNGISVSTCTPNSDGKTSLCEKNLVSGAQNLDCSAFSSLNRKSFVALSLTKSGASNTVSIAKVS